MTDKERAQDRKRPENIEPDEKHTPERWAKLLGHVKKYGRGTQAAFLFSAAYETACVHYGWRLQAHHWGPDSLKLTQKDFEAAMAASAKYPTVQLHGPAISKVVADARANFEPLKAHKD